MEECAIREGSAMCVAGIEDADSCGRTKYTTSATTAIIMTVKEMFSMQNTPGGHRLFGMQ
jgi:hypothetical protein